MKAPIALFVYARPDHVRRTVEALLRNKEAGDTDLIVFSDAAKTVDKRAAVEEVRSYIEKIQGFRSVSMFRRSCNFGLAKSIIEGVTQVLSEYETVIVVEDDMITSSHFLSYMNEGLTRYAHDDRVISIHGYMYPVDEPVPEAFFLRGADCWGWATWRRGWALFNPDGQYLLEKLRDGNLIDEFDFNGAYGYSKMLQEQIEGRNDSWAIRWYASAFLANKLTLYPGQSLVQNIGNDSSGTHCGTSIVYDANLKNSPINLSETKVEHSEVAFQAIERFFGKKGSFLERLLSRIKLKLHQYRIRSLAKDWLPPALLRLLRRMLRKKRCGYEGPFTTWEEARSLSTGYASRQILDNVLSATLKVKSGQAAFERDSVTFDEVHVSWPVAAVLMWAATQGRGRLSVLDFGGSLGSSYFQNRQFFDGLQSIRWSVIEQSHFVQAGRRYIQDERLSFYESIEDCLMHEEPNVVLLSSVIQYVEDPYLVLEMLSNSEAQFLVVDRSPFWARNLDAVMLQHVPKYIYDASYPFHVFSEVRFLAALDNRWELISEFDTPEDDVNTDAGKFAFKGFIFVRKQQ